MTHVATLFVLGVKSHRFGVVSPRSGYVSWAFYALIFKRSYLFYLLKSRIWYAVGKFFRSLNLIFYLLYKSSRNPHQAQKQCFNFELPINSSRCSLVQIARNEFQCQTIVHDLAVKNLQKNNLSFTWNLLARASFVVGRFFFSCLMSACVNNASLN